MQEHVGEVEKNHGSCAVVPTVVLDPAPFVTWDSAAEPFTKSDGQDSIVGDAVLQNLTNHLGGQNSGVEKFQSHYSPILMIIPVSPFACPRESRNIQAQFPSAHVVDFGTGADFAP